MSNLSDYYNEEIRIPSIKNRIKNLRGWIEHIDGIYSNEEADEFRLRLSNLTKKFYNLGGKNDN